MKLLATITLPLYVHTTKSHTTKGKVIFNLNNYRNMFHTKSNDAKIAMTEYIKGLAIPNLGIGPFRLEYIYYHGNRAKVDVANPCSIIDKFTCDAFTEAGLWPDDNYQFVKEVEYRWGGVVPNQGHCVLKIFEL